MPEAKYIPGKEEIQLRASSVHAIFVLMKNEPMKKVEFVSDLVIEHQLISITDACDLLSFGELCDKTYEAFETITGMKLGGP
jgi:hypothetical protein